MTVEIGKEVILLYGIRKESPGKVNSLCMCIHIHESNVLETQKDVVYKTVETALAPNILLFLLFSIPDNI